jgi:hypothetical protein
MDGATPTGRTRLRDARGGEPGGDAGWGNAGRDDTRRGRRGEGAGGVRDRRRDANMFVLLDAICASLLLNPVRKGCRMSWMRSVLHAFFGDLSLTCIAPARRAYGRTSTRTSVACGAPSSYGPRRASTGLVIACTLPFALGQYLSKVHYLLHLGNILTAG